MIMIDLRQHVSKSAYVVFLFKSFRVFLARGIAAFSSWALHLVLRRLAFQKFPEVKIGSSLQPRRIPSTAQRSAIKGVCLATPGPRSRTIALAVRLCFAVLVLRFNDTRFPLPLLTQIAKRHDFLFLILA